MVGRSDKNWKNSRVSISNTSDLAVEQENEDEVDNFRDMAQDHGNVENEEPQF